MKIKDTPMTSQGRWGIPLNLLAIIPMATASLCSPLAMGSNFISLREEAPPTEGIAYQPMPSSTAYYLIATTSPTLSTFIPTFVCSVAMWSRSGTI
jgi:hypothetical protein